MSGEPREKAKPEMPLLHLLPNMLTIAAICAGLSAIRFALQGDFALAVQLILAACVLDGLDGRVARGLACDSALGAELDSLADFLNFGVAPPLLVYFWALEDMGGGGWICVLVFAVCCLLRLARFNVGIKSEGAGGDPAYFVGVPAPAGALLLLWPMFLSFAFAGAPVPGPLWIGVYMVAVGLLLVSRVPVRSFKTATVSRRNAKAVLFGVAFGVAAVLTFAWETLAVMCLGYMLAVVWALVAKLRPSVREET